MPGGTELTAAEVQPQKEPEVLESPEKGTEVREAVEELQKVDDATLAPEAVVEQGDYTVSENLQTAITEAVTAVPEVAVRPGEDLSTPEPIPGSESAPATSEGLEAAVPTITLEGAGVAGRVTIERAAEAAADGGPKTEDRVEVAADETVMIDTVPLPETPAVTAEAGSREADSRETIGTWPTPEVSGASSSSDGDVTPPPGDGMDPIPPSNDPTSGVHSVSGARTAEDDSGFRPEMAGELSRFEAGDGSETFGFNGDGSTSTTSVIEHIQDRNSLGIGPENIQAEAASLKDALDQDTDQTLGNNENDLSSELEPESFPGVGSVSNGSGISTANESILETYENQENIKDQIDQLEKNLDAMEKDLKDLQNQLDSEEAELIKLQDQLDAVRASEPQRPSRESFADDDSGNHAYNSAISQYNESIAANNAKANTLESKITAQENVISNVLDQISDLQKNIDKTKEKIANLYRIFKIVGSASPPSNLGGLDID